MDDIPVLPTWLNIEHENKGEDVSIHENEKNANVTFPPAVYRLAQGALCGTLLVTFGYPFDTVKTRLQQRPVFTGPLLSHLYKGATWPLLGTVCTNSIFFSVRHAAEDEHGANPFLSGALAGGVAAPVTAFANSGKIWNQVHGGHTAWPPTRAAYWSRAIGTTAARDIPAMAFYFGTFDVVRTRLEKEVPDVPEVARLMIAGGAAGAASWTISYPADTIASRVLSNSVESIMNAWRKGHWWKGFSVCMARAVLVNALTLSGCYTVFHKVCPPSQSIFVEEV